jgi:hypothetical protein
MRQTTEIEKKLDEAIKVRKQFKKAPVAELLNEGFIAALRWVMGDSEEQIIRKSNLGFLEKKIHEEIKKVKGRQNFNQYIG